MQLSSVNQLPLADVWSKNLILFFLSLCVLCFSFLYFISFHFFTNDYLITCPNIWQGGRETNPMYGFVNQSVTLLVWTRVVQMSASPGTNNSTAHIKVSASHHGLSMRSSIDSSMRDSKWLSEPFPSLIQLQIWSSCTCVNGWICTYSLPGLRTTIHEAILYIYGFKRITSHWIGLKFRFPLLLHPIPYFRSSWELDIEIEKMEINCQVFRLPPKTN